MRFRMAGPLLIGILFAAAVPSFGGGFFTGEIGARASGKGGANIVGEDTLNALAINPAALYRSRGTNLMLQNDFDIYHTSYRREPYLETSYNRNPLDNIQSIFVATDFHLEKDFTLGFGIFGPYGVTIRYPDNSPARYNALDINSVQVNFALEASWKVADWLAVGGGPTLVSSRIENYYGFSVLRDRNAAYDVKAQFAARKDYAPGWIAGVIVSPAPWFEFGGSYVPRSPNLAFEGTVTAELPDFYGVILGQNVFKDNIRATIDYPEYWRFGARYIHKDLFDVEVGASFIPWSLVSGYDVDLEQETILEDFVLELGWQDAWTYRAGTDWRLNEHFRVRGGAFYEEQVAPDSSLGGGSIETAKTGVGTGFTISLLGVTTDWAYQHIFVEPYSVPPNPAADVTDDGRGEIRASYDRFIGAVNLNFEKILRTYKGGGSKR
ncbi:MAG: outer membrane protein transport protein [Deltaproteobacteria bacterium]|nr:outer membrane protein transport protein [Deltaproteobacteria bacterium]